MAGDSSTGATAAMSKLSLDQSKLKTKKAAVADSWEDESSDGEEGGKGKQEQDDDEADAPERRRVPPPYNPSTPAQQTSGFAAPPPTPSTPSYNADASWKSMMAAGGGEPGSPDAERKRPEKTDAVARRMIASALGVKAPRLTDEQRAYDRALRDKERKRREAEKEEEKKRKEDAEKAKLAMWED